uniref:Uncharacterized protein n=1 Tax=Glossina austeni TaxID=7395 RepID=A0A1A9VDC6_GLOAU
MFAEEKIKKITQLPREYLLKFNKILGDEKLGVNVSLITALPERQRNDKPLLRNSVRLTIRKVIYARWNSVYLSPTCRNENSPQNAPASINSLQRQILLHLLYFMTMCFALRRFVTIYRALKY